MAWAKTDKKEPVRSRAEELVVAPKNCSAIGNDKGIRNSGVGRISWYPKQSVAFRMAPSLARAGWGRYSAKRPSSMAT